MQYMEPPWLETFIYEPSETLFGSCDPGNLRDLDMQPL